VAGESGHETSEERPVLAVEQVRRWDGLFARLTGGQDGSGSLQGAVDGGRRRSEELGHFGARQAQHFPQDEHRPLTGGQAWRAPNKASSTSSLVATASAGSAAASRSWA
jgi:hypothetical protein